MRVIGAAIIVIGVLIYLSFGTLSPCGMLRESIRKQDTLTAALPDSLVDLALVAQYGALSPGRCIGILLGGQNAPVATKISPVQQTLPQQASRPVSSGEDAMRAALKEAETAINECRAKRLSGELRTYAESAKCSNPRIAQSFNAANYRYMDLIEWLAEQRLQLAYKMDRREMTDEQARAASKKLFTAIVDEERRREAARR